MTYTLPTLSQAVRSRLFRFEIVLLTLAFVAFLGADSLYLTIAGAVAGSALSGVVGFTAEFGILFLVVTAGLVAVWSWFHHRIAFRRLVAGGAGVILAYLTSEVIKLIVQEERPCRALDVATVLTCPAVGDWSWPSNHSVLAGAFATACVLAMPRLERFLAPVALLIALSRVGAGVHYLHDALSGLALGIAVVACAVMVLRPVLDRFNTPSEPSLIR